MPRKLTVAVAVVIDESVAAEAIAGFVRGALQVGINRLGADGITIDSATVISEQEA